MNAKKFWNALLDHAPYDTYFHTTLGEVIAIQAKITKLEAEIVQARAQLGEAEQRHEARVLAASSEWPESDVLAALRKAAV